MAEAVKELLIRVSATTELLRSQLIAAERQVTSFEQTTTTATGRVSNALQKTGGNEYTWDAAYGIEVTVASTGIKYGGPNDTTSNNARGALIFEVWDATELLAGKLYDPGTRVEKATTSNLAMTAFDTTNLRLSFTAPASGRVMWRVSVPSHGATTAPQVLLGILQSTTVKARSAPVAGHPSTAVATANAMLEATGVISGLEAAKEYTWDAAYGVEVTVTSTSLKYGGPNNTTENDAQGGIAFEIWAA